ncbi:hypothetical protein AWY96_05170 [Serratia plymuthica]|uniref:hypothetical protein n=1 Tax=Serratia plymuthica TaxID=82996 RepID=UPI0007A0D085|nr:hypothetical protein [Serratia plymuthica]KYQ97924.1 hypothetical protein AWY96_05170 [Serratia plymuthica]
MNASRNMNSLKGRIQFVQDKLASISSKGEMSFADRLMFNNMDSYLSDLKAEQRAEDARHPLLDFMELRLKGTVVDLGTIPLEMLGIISSNLAALVQRATHKLSSGKDSFKVPYSVKSSLNMRLAELSPGSTRLGLTFSTGQCELVETVSSKAVKEIIDLLDANDALTVMNQIAEIGYNSAQSLKKIVEECDKNHINFDLSWVGPFSEGRRTVAVTTPKIKILNDRLAATTISQPSIETISGVLASLSKYGKMELEIDGDKIKASFPIDILDEIQKKHKVGQQVSLTVEVTDIHNENLGLHRKNYLVKSLK